MKLKSPNYMVIHTTPSELREIADRLDKKWAAARPGEVCPYEEFVGFDGTTVRVVVDQETQHDIDRKVQARVEEVRSRMLDR